MKRTQLWTMCSIALCILLAVACTDSQPGDNTSDKSTTNSKSKPMADLITLDLSEHGSLQAMSVPTLKTQGVAPSIRMDDISGYLTISVGKGFDLLVREEPTTLEDIRQEMENEMMWKNKVLSSDAESVLIERSLPDGTMSQFHFAAVLPGTGSNVVLRSNPMGEFSQKQAERMLQCAKTLTVNADLTASN